MKSLESNVSQDENEVDQEELQRLKDIINNQYLNEGAIQVQTDRRKIKMENNIESKQRSSNFTTMSLLEEYNLQDMNDPENQPFIADETFVGPLEDRFNTDKRYTFCFFILLIAFLTVSIYLMTQGSLDRLKYGQDFRAEICGTGLLKDKKYQYFLEPSVNADVYMCVNKCPSETGPKICLYDRNQTIIPQFCYTQLSTTLYQHYCMNDEPQNSQKVKKWIVNSHSLFFRLVADIYMTWPILISSLLIAVVVMTGVNLILQHEHFIKAMVWISTWSTFITINLFALVCYSQYDLRVKFICINRVDVRNCGDLITYIYQYMAFALIILSVIYILFMMFQYNSVNLSISLMKTTVKTSKVIRELAFIPYILILLAILNITLTLFTIFSSTSIGTIITVENIPNINGNRIRKIQYSEYYFYIFIGIMSSSIILIQFLNRVNDMIISYSLTLWYFTKQKETLRLPIKRVISVPIKYHFGTIFKVTIMEFFFSYFKITLGVIINYLKSKPQHYRSVRFISNVMRCQIYWYMNSLRYIDRNLFTQISLWNDNYTQSSKRQFFLQYRNRELTRDVEFITFLVIFQLKLFCSAFGCIFYASITYALYSNDLTSYMMGVVITFIFNFQITGIVMNQHYIVSKTIILNYYIDNEMFIGDQRYVEQFIQEFMQIFSNVERQDKRIVVDTYKPEIKAGTTTVNPMDEEIQALKFKSLVDNNKVEYSVNQDDPIESTQQLNPSVLLKNVNKFGKPISNKKIKNNQVGFDDNPNFSRNKPQNNLNDYDPFNGDFNNSVQPIQQQSTQQLIGNQSVQQNRSTQQLSDNQFRSLKEQSQNSQSANIFGRMG